MTKLEKITVLCQPSPIQKKLELPEGASLDDIQKELYGYALTLLEVISREPVDQNIDLDLPTLHTLYIPAMSLVEIQISYAMYCPEKGLINLFHSSGTISVSVGDTEYSQLKTFVHRELNRMGYFFSRHELKTHLDKMFAKGKK